MSDSENLDAMVEAAQQEIDAHKATSLTADAIVERTWAGEIPFYLHIFRADGQEAVIDIEEPQWMTTYADWMRGRSRWYLMVKESKHAMLAVDVMEDDQPYYAAKHIHRLTGRNAGGHLVAYGIGAKRKDGTTDRMWVLPNGIVCSGEDVMSLGEALLG